MAGPSSVKANIFTGSLLGDFLVFFSPIHDFFSFFITWGVHEFMRLWNEHHIVSGNVCRL